MCYSDDIGVITDAEVVRINDVLVNAIWAGIMARRHGEEVLTHYDMGLVPEVKRDGVSPSWYRARRLEREREATV